MPHLQCPACALAQHTVAWHVGRDVCPRCGTIMTRVPRTGPARRAAVAADGPARLGPVFRSTLDHGRRA